MSVCSSPPLTVGRTRNGQFGRLRFIANQDVIIHRDLRLFTITLIASFGG
jgi:hypothetical protein